MKSEKKILSAFILNTLFSALELFGGLYTGSAAIISDAVHDAGDAVSIGIAYFLEKKSKKQPDKTHTYGYARYSLLGGIITSAILFISSLAVIFSGIKKAINPTEINTNRMMIFAIIGVIINFVAAVITRKGESLNSKAVNLHMLEDVLGWIAVLICSIVIKLTGFILIDPIVSIAVALFIGINASKNLREASDIFLEKTPDCINISEIQNHICEIDGVIDVHHIHIRSIDGNNNYATMHIVTDNNSFEVKEKIRKILSEHGICHSTLEFESKNEKCSEKQCHTETATFSKHHHHH